MRLVIQRVNHASVTVDEQVIGKIGKGLLVFLGVADGDTKEMVDKYVKKLQGLRIFEDADGKTNLSIQDVGGEVLVVSQFTHIVFIFWLISFSFLFLFYLLNLDS